MYENKCVCCGEIIPEGMQVCWSCEHGLTVKLPSEAQIQFADFIAEVLEIDFPQSSDEFTAKTYYEFIHSHIDEARQYMDDDRGDGLWDDIMWTDPLNQ